MTSANDTPNGDFDERLSQALDAALTEGEQLVAQETGDQGQAIALTKSRILVAKAGFAGTGELNGHKVTGFDLETVTSINLRKGPLGAVIQICAEGGENQAPSGPPDNVVVFTGPGRVKRAEAFAAQIEFLTGKQVNRMDPTARAEAPAVREEETPAPAEDAQADKQEAPAKPKGGRVAKSLAEEIYGEVMEAQKNPVAPSTEPPVETPPQPVENSAPKVDPAPAPVQQITEEDDEEEEDILQPTSQYNPNPRLPKPTRKQKQGPSSILVILGVAGALVLIGMAIMAPVRQLQNDSVIVADKGDVSGAKVAKAQLAAVSKYQSQIAGLVAKADAEAANVKSAVRSGNKTALRTIGEAGKTDEALDTVSARSAPLGLAEAQQDLTNGLMAQKTAIATAAAAAQSGSLSPSDTVSRLDQAGAQIRKGMATISRAKAELEKQRAEPATAKH